MQQLRQRLAELTDLRHAGHLLEWDQQTMMPPRGAGARAEAISTVRRLCHEAFIDAGTGRLLEAAAVEVADLDADSDDSRLVAVMRRRWEKARRVPTELAADAARAASLGHDAWLAARAESDFAAFAPYLARNLELARAYVECFDEFPAPYDALLDDYEPGMRSTQVTALFDELKAELVPIIATLADHADRVQDACLHGRVAESRQRELAGEVLVMMGFDPSAWRLDDAAHPFAASLGLGDMRLTTRWDEAYFPSSLYGAMHECGHGLYEAGIDPALKRTPIGYAESLGLHESQSRLWENMVGRGRSFCGALAPRITALLGGPLAGIDGEDLYRAVNRVKPSLIRVEADEATYGLHIVLRFELEQELIEGRLRVQDLPAAWNERMERYLGVQVPNDADGVLQDVHWASGLIGYFPTYALGNLIAGQLWQRVHADIPELEAQIGAGELMGLREWLREHVHRHGAKFSTNELLARLGDGPIAVAPFVSYLKDKLSDVYGVELHMSSTP